MYEYKVTVFTSTYNRGYIIDHLYQSLRRQTCNNFEWVVIDDGSTDNTNILFEAWVQNELLFPIKYVLVEHGGKHRALNKGIAIAQGELFFLVDSDDYITDDAIEKLNRWNETLKYHSSNFVGIAGNRGYNNNDIIGDTFDGYYIDATSLERRRKNIIGDKAEAYYTSILKQYKFPEIDGENFLTESVVWSRIAADGYKIRWFNEIIYICSYLDDGLTKTGDQKFINNPKGYALLVREQIKFHKYSFRERLAAYYRYHSKLRASLSEKEICANLNIDIFFLELAVCLGRVKDFLRNMFPVST